MIFIVEGAFLFVWFVLWGVFRLIRGAFRMGPFVGIAVLIAIPLLAWLFVWSTASGPASGFGH